MKKYKNMSEQDYRGIKTFLEVGIPPKQVFQVTGRSVNTIRAVGKSSDFEGYKATIQAKYKKPATPIQQAAEVVQDELMVKLDNIELKLNQLTVAVNVLLEEADRQRSQGKVDMWKRG